MLIHTEKGFFFSVASQLPVSEKKIKFSVQNSKAAEHSTSSEQPAGPCAGKYHNNCPHLSTVTL